MARGAKTTMKITGYDELLQDIEEMAGSAEDAVERALTKAGELAIQEYEKVAEKHHYSGITEESIVRNPVIHNNGSKMEMRTGYDISDGGLASIYLDRGTPKQQPVKYLDKIKRNRKIKKAIEEELRNY